MFRSVKLKNARLTVFCLIGVLLLTGTCALALRSGAPDTVVIHGEKVALTAKNEADVERFLKACGYETPELIFQHEIIIPKHWNNTYTDYNELQRSQGFDLTPYKGKDATELNYFVSDAQSITVLLSEEKIIAAHIASCDGSELEIVIP